MNRTSPLPPERGEPLRAVIKRHVEHYRKLPTNVSIQSTDWAKRHACAIRRDDGGAAIPMMLDSLATYADRHATRYESLIGEDGVLGPAWLQMLEGVRTLLNGEIGQLDGGATDGLLFDLARAAGFSEFDGEPL